MSQNQYMDQALNAALDGQKLGEVPIGCVIIDENKNILSLTHNRVIGDNDPTAHAEILAIREACSKIQASRLVNCSLYVTLEPCLMCASAISRAKIKRLFYGADDNKYGSINGSINFFQSNICNHIPEIYDNICKDKCENIINNFFKDKR